MPTELILVIERARLTKREKRLRDWCSNWNTNKIQTVHNFYFFSHTRLEEAFKGCGLKEEDYPLYPKKP